MKSQSFGYVLLVVGFLVTSCSQQNTTTESALQPSTNSQPIPQQTFTPITGAFGWKLGEKVEMHNEMKVVSYTSQEDSTILPFEHVIVSTTKDGLIYEIAGFVYPKEEDYSNLKKGIIDALAEKYQILPGYTPNKAYCEFGDKTNSVELEDNGHRLTLKYKNTPLYDAVMSDVRKRMEEEKTRKEQGIKDSLRGL
jgi:hypothetical protein